MGCNNSKNVTVPINTLGSEGSSVKSEEEDAVFVKSRTWGTPAPPLPDIKSRDESRDQSCDVSLFRATENGTTMNACTSRDTVVAQKTRGGAAFVIQDENAGPQKLPPRRLQSIKGAKKLSMDELIRKQQEHDEKRKQQLKEKVNKIKSRPNLKKREFERAQQMYSQAEKKHKKAEVNKQRMIEQRANKAKERNQKVQLVRNKTILRESDNNLNLSGKLEHDTEYNKSESESWDNESLKNIYDQMDYIPVAPVIRNNINNSDDEFFS